MLYLRYKLYLLSLMMLCASAGFAQTPRSAAGKANSKSRSATSNSANEAISSRTAFENIVGLGNGFSKVLSKGKWRIVNPQGVSITKNIYDSIRNFSDQMAAVSINGKWGFVNEKGEQVVATIYDKVRDYQESVTVVINGEEDWKWINKKGEKTIVKDAYFDKQGHRLHQKDLQKMVAPEQPRLDFQRTNSVMAGVPCPTNMGFENGNFQGWQTNIGTTTYSGTTNIINLGATWLNNANTPTRQDLMDSMNHTTDPYGHFPTTAPGGGRYSLKLGNSSASAQAEGARYRFQVPTTGTFSLTFNYAVVFEQPNHPAYQEPRLDVKLYNHITGDSIPCATFTFVSSAGLPGFSTSNVSGPTGSPVLYKPWSSVYVNLNAYAGQTLYLDFITADCTQNAHFGYAYVDVQECGIAAVGHYNCSDSGLTLTGPPGFQTYQWYNNNYTSLIGTGQNLNLPPGTPNTNQYWVVATPYTNTGCATCNCKDTASVSIANLVYPNANAGVDKIICPTQPVQIGTAAVPDVTYQWSPATYLSNANVAQPMASPPVTTTYILTVSDAYGCSKKDTVVVNVVAAPTVDFTVNSLSQCLQGNNFQFNNTSSGTTSYNWNFGDATTATATSTSHVYSAPGTYTVTLSGTGGTGCTGSITKTVTVTVPPTPAATVNTSIQCVTGNNFNFTNTSVLTGGAFTSAWTFGDGGTASTLNATHNYTLAGNYLVKLIVTSSVGCMDSVTVPVTVQTKPIPDFSINSPINQCMNGNLFSFTNGSTISNGNMTYQWFFGDGGTSTTANSSHTYSASGSYIVKLVVTSNGGCKDSITRTVNVYDKPSAVFSVNQLAQCLTGNNFTFNNTSSIASGTYTGVWNFGDGNTSNSLSPSHSYLLAGPYQVHLVLTSNHGCIDSLTQTVQVDPKPDAVFSVNTANQCVNGNSYLFTNASSISTGAITYSWNLGNGNTSTSVNPSYTYPNPGTYTVKLVVTSTGGCKDSITHPVSVYAKPTPAYSINIPAQCLTGNNFSFTSSSSISAGSYTPIWNFGDGNTSNSSNAIHSYLAAGTFLVNLVLTSDHGCKDSVTQNVVVNPKPTPDFTINAPAQCLNGNNFGFTNGSSISSGSTSLSWSFGDGNTSTTTNPSHTYGIPGTYNVNLVVSSNAGCKDSIVRTVTVHPKPAVDFAVAGNNQCLNGNNFAFNNLSNISAGSINFSWDFGDGNTSTANSPTHSYLAGGSYIVKLLGISNNGCKDSITRSVTINVAPTAAASVNTANQCINGNNFSFANTSSLATGTFTSAWNLGDGFLSSQTNVNHSYLAAGSYTVKLIVTSVNGCKDSINVPVTVYAKPTPGFSFGTPPNQCVNGNNYTFNNTSSIAGGNLTYNWSFGDGGISTATNGSYSYTAPGTYTVSLVVTSANGCKDSVSNPVTIYYKPTPAYSINLSAQCVNGNNFSFTNGSSIGAGTYSGTWLFGDGGSSNNSNPSHSYTQPGTYPVTLILTSDHGCKDSIAQNVMVNPKPSVNFTVSNSGQCLNGNSYAFNNVSSISSGTTTSSWNFGDGNTSTSVNPNYSYGASGTYNVQLIVSSNNGCKDSITKPVTVFPKPNASVAVNAAGQCLNGNNFNFANTSNISSGTISSSWVVSNGVTSSQPSLSLTFPTAGSYTVTLISISDKGCKDSIATPVSVYPMPHALFYISMPYQCVNSNNYAFNNNSSIPTGSMNYNWVFGDGNTSAAQNPVYNYTAPGIYTVKMVTISDHGCKDSMNTSVQVYPKPTVDFSVNSLSECLKGNSFFFTNNSSISSTGITPLWHFGDGSSSGLANPSHIYINAGVYQVNLVITSVYSCKDSLVKPITVHPNPQLNFGAANPVILCRGDSAQLNVSGAQNYTWTPATAISCTNCSGPKAFPTTTTTYYVTGIDSFNCPGKDTLLVDVKQPINVTALNAVSCAQDSVRLHATGGANYQWSPSTGLSSTTVSNPMVALSGTNTYTVIGYDGFNCFTDTATALVTIKPRPIVELGADLELPSGTEQPLLATIQNGPIVNWLWSPTNDLSCAACATPIATIKNDITYTVRVTNAAGCTSYDTLRIRAFCKDAQVFIANAFTPNGDGLNDILFVQGSGVALVNYFRVYDRWGELVFEQKNFAPNDTRFGWDGRIRGVLAPPDVFVYTAEVVCENKSTYQYKGNVTIMK